VVKSTAQYRRATGKRAYTEKIQIDKRLRTQNKNVDYETKTEKEKREIGELLTKGGTDY